MSVEGYGPEIFLNQDYVNKHMCPMYDSFLNKSDILNASSSTNFRCHCVYKVPTKIGCPDEHIFCKECLERYFTRRAKPCPLCRHQGLTMSKTKLSHPIDRLIKCLKIRCDLQYELEMKQDDANEVECKWQGDLGDLARHKIYDCPLLPIVCQNCTTSFKRYELNGHYGQCPEMKIPCELKCSFVDIYNRSLCEI